eukprot:scaffold6634_cov158-Amphora_coffeaeformis.AAC.5
MTRCSVSSISLSGLSISSEDSTATNVTAASGSTIARSSLKRGLGSVACANLRALSVQMEESSRMGNKDDSMGMQVDTTGDEWGYFVDATPPATYGGIHISW